MDRFPSNFINKFRLLSNNSIQVKRILRIFALGTASMTSQISSNKSDSAAKEGHKMVDKAGMTALTRLIYYDLGLFPWVCVVVYFIVVHFAGREF
jgi:hypothetical protein